MSNASEASQQEFAARWQPLRKMFRFEIVP
jgi:hypothetical protein